MGRAMLEGQSADACVAQGGGQCADPRAAPGPRARGAEGPSPSGAQETALGTGRPRSGAHSRQAHPKWRRPRFPPLALPRAHPAGAAQIPLRNSGDPAPRRRRLFRRAPNRAAGSLASPAGGLAQVRQEGLEASLLATAAVAWPSGSTCCAPGPGFRLGLFPVRAP